MKALYLLLIIVSGCFATCLAKGPGEKGDYQGWYPCVIIARHDTIAGKLKPKSEYFGRHPFTMLMPSGKERIIKPSDIAQLWIINPHDTVKYLSVNTDGQMGPITTLYLILVDGQCRLLYTEGVRATNVLSLGNGSTWAYSNIYTIYYKDELWDVVGSNDFFAFDPETDFTRLGRIVFKDCTQIAYRLEIGEYKKKDIRKLITEFNACIGNVK